MSPLEFFGLACATVIFVWSPLFARLRAWRPGFLECAMCLGFWIGLFGSVALHPRAGVAHFFIATSVAVTAFAIDVALSVLQSLLDGRE